MAKRDYYEVLGVPRGASNEAIRKAYRKVALECHPDRNPGNKQAEERFKEAAEAYEVLRDPEKRSLFDRYGHEGLKHTGFTGFRGFEDIFSHFSDVFGDFGGFGDIFGFGTRRERGARPQAGAHLRYDLELTFEEAAFGKEMELEVERYQACPICGGDRLKPGSRPEPCATCGGRGQVTRSQGFFSISTTCPHCRGEGVIITTPCEECGGAGRVLRTKKLSVRVPAGVDDGSRLRLQNEGEGGINGGPPGDLYVFLHVKPHEFFVRDGDDLHCEVPISFAQAALGTDLKVPTLDGAESVTIPKGTQSGDTFRLKNAGIPHLRRNGRGDQIIKARVQTPRKLTKRQEALLREFAEIEAKHGGREKRHFRQHG